MKLSLPIKQLAAIVALAKAENYSDIEFKLKVFETLYNLLAKQEKIDDFDIIANIEDFANYRNDDEMFRLLNQMDLLDQHDGQYQLKKEIYLNKLIDVGADSQNKSIVIDDLQQLNIQQTVNDNGNLQIISTSQKTVVTLILITNSAVADSSMRCLPAFWKKEYTKYIPHFPDNASTASFAVIDTLKLLRHHLTEEEQERVDQNIQILLDRCIALIKDDNSEDTGAFFLENDDDYPGAQRPTTCSNAVLLSLLVTKQKYKKQIKGIVGFLKRMQQENGGFGFYNFSDYNYPVEPLILLEVVKSLCLLQKQEYFSDEEKKTAQDILNNCRRYLLESSKTIQDATVWYRSSNPDNWDIYVTTQNALALLYLAESKAQQEQAFSALRYVLKHWQPSIALDSADNFDVIPFRSPTADGPALGNVSWKQEGNAKILFLLSSAYINFNLQLSFDDLTKLNTAATTLCARSSSEGYWEAFGMPGIIQVFNTATTAKALLLHSRVLAKYTLGDETHYS